ncbi:TonB-dependent receptor [Niabella defluvii]|nr:TonB-dependent receptor [Niabella sp. I65]
MALPNLIPNEALGLAGLDQGQPVSVTSLSSRYTLASFLARANYSFASRYLLTASFRADGSSKFSPENKWSYFPSGAFAWRLSNESFMKNVNLVSDAKIRLSYGTTGNNRVSDFAYLTQIALPSDIGYSYTNVPVKAAVLSSLGNKNLKWETTSPVQCGPRPCIFR